MKRQTVLSQKPKRGPKPTGKGQLIGVRLQPSDVSALDAYAESADLPTRPQAIRTILSDWLAVHGFMKRSAHTHANPKGPATEVVKAMDEAIEEHKKSAVKAKSTDAKTKSKQSSREWRRV